MTLGPPPTSAGSSQTGSPAPAANPGSATTTARASSSQANQGFNAAQRQAGPATYSVYSLAPPQSSRDPQQATPQNTNYYSNSAQPIPPNYAYYNYASNTWGGPWPVGAYSYGSGAYQYPQPNTQSASPQGVPQSHYATVVQPPPKSKTPSPSPSPSPPPEFHKQWDAILRAFLAEIGLTQALRGFEADMVVMNSDWERKKVPAAIGNLVKGLLSLGEQDHEVENAPKERPLEDRKLDYIHLAGGKQPSTPTNMTRSISHFLAQNRARNDASNRAEFLESLAEKRRRLNQEGDSEAISSCARTDAKTQNRDLQMKYDIAKNEDGPLRKTLQADKPPESRSGTSANGAKPASNHMSNHNPALEERLHNIETHLAVRYVPYPPHSFLDRLRYLEDHIVHLEKEYPPWAALHFNQPNRGWPPPPRSTPIIVPSHLTSTATRPEKPLTSSLSGPSRTPPGDPEAPESGPSRTKGKGRTTKSSLHRAVMEKLEVQKAMNDLAGIGDGG